MEQESIRRLFLVVLALLPIQFGLVGLLGAGMGEPWPAVVLPGFKSVWQEGEKISIPRAAFNVRFASGEVGKVDPAQVLAGLPASHHLAVMRRQFTPASMSGSTRTETGALPESRRWLANRLADLFPGRDIVGADVVWNFVEYRRLEGALRETPIDTLSIDLP
ncbi:MAG: hypothetical protein WD275_06510 [Rhodothermales bacterium]